MTKEEAFTALDTAKRTAQRLRIVTNTSTLNEARVGDVDPTHAYCLIGVGSVAEGAERIRIFIAAILSIEVLS